MRIEWTPKALRDLQRVEEFYARRGESLAKRTVEFLLSAPDFLPDNPRIGERLDKYDPREVRRLIVGEYEMRYEIKGETIFIVRLWHTREDR